MWPEPWIVQFLDGIFHIFMAQELNDAGSIFIHIGKTNIAGFSHMVLQVLPGTGSGQSRHHDTELWSSGGRAAVAPITPRATPAVAIASAAAAVSTGPSTARELHSQPVPVVVVPITSLHGIVSITVKTPNSHYFHWFKPLLLSDKIIPGILELDKSKWRPAAVFQVNEGYFAEFVEQILNVLGAYVRRKVSHVDSALVATVRHDFMLRKISNYATKMAEETQNYAENVQASRFGWKSRRKWRRLPPDHFFSCRHSQFDTSW